MEKIILMNVSELNNGLSMSKKTVKAGKSFPLHWHDYFELEIVVYGCAEHIHNQKKYIATQGNTYLLSYFDFHSFKAIEDTEIISIKFDASVLNAELIKHISEGTHIFNCTFDCDELSSVLRKTSIMESEMKNKQLFSKQMIENILSELIIGMIRRSKDEKEKPTPHIIQKVVLYIIMNFRDGNISLRHIAEKMNVSVNYLGFLFQNTMDISFREYLNMLRIKYACRLLLSSELSMKEIAYSSGYKTNEHFLRCFKRETGMTPSEFKRECGEIRM